MFVQMRFFLSKSRVSLDTTSQIESRRLSSASSSSDSLTAARLTLDDLPPQCVFNVCIHLDSRSSEKTVATDRDITADELIVQLIKALMLPNRGEDAYELVMIDRKGETKVDGACLVLVAYYSRRRVRAEVTLTMKHSIVHVVKEIVQVKVQHAPGVEKIEVEVPKGLTAVELLSLLVPKLPDGAALALFSNDTRYNLCDKVADDGLCVRLCERSPDASLALSTSQQAVNSLTGLPVMQELVKAIGRDTQNYVCADCKAANPTFVSSNLGITLCIACALQHCSLFIGKRSFVSRVRPIRDYTWSREIIQILKAAGNSTAARFHKARGTYGKDAAGKYTFYYQPQLRGALLEAIERQNIVDVMQALQQGADPNGGESAPIPLHLACFLGCPAIVELLLRFGADPTKADQVGHSALYYGLLARDSELAGKLRSCQTFFAFLREQQKKLGLSAEQESDEDVQMRDNVLLAEWLRSIGHEHAPTQAALQAIGLEVTCSFPRLCAAVFREADARSKAQRVKAYGYTVEPSQQSPPTPYASLSPTEFRRLMDGVLEELGMREYIAVHSRSWRQRRSAIKWLAGAHQVIVSPYGDKLELEAYLQREEVGWMGKLKEMQRRERDHARRAVESPIVLQIPATENVLPASK